MSISFDDYTFNLDKNNIIKKDFGKFFESFTEEQIKEWKSDEEALQDEVMDEVEFQEKIKINYDEIYEILKFFKTSKKP